MPNRRSKLGVKAVKGLFRPTPLFSENLDRVSQCFLVLSKTSWVLFSEMVIDCSSQGHAKAPWLLVP